jgi:hypothetical protein
MSAGNYIKGMALDAVTKLSHFKSAGAATQHLQPVLSQHFGTVNQLVQDKHAAGTFNLDSCVNGEDSQEEEEEEEEAKEETCTTAMHCAR